MAAIAAPGDLDTTFNGTGIVTSAIGSGNDEGFSVAVQTDGKIVVVGGTHNGTDYDFAIRRYNPDGSVDTSFGAGLGYVTTTFGTSTDYAQGVALQSDGKIVVAGRTALTAPAPNDFAVARYNTDGSLDTSFNGTGKVVTAIGPGSDEGVSVAIQSDGKIVVVGKASNGTNDDFAVVRYLSNGTLDTSFDGDGMVMTDIGGGTDLGIGVAIQSDGKILVSGKGQVSGTKDLVLVRYETNGALDASFSGDGKANADFGGSDEGLEMALQPDGKAIVVGGGSGFLVARFDTNGALDTTFNGTGKVITSAGFAVSAVVQGDGKIIVAGYASNGSNNDFSLVRYNADGVLDTSFSGDGKVTTPIGSGKDEGYVVTLQPDGRILVVGLTFNGTNNDIALVRYLGGPVIDQSGPVNTTDFRVAPITGQTETFNNNGFDITSTYFSSIGNYGTGTFNQTGGLHSTPFLAVGDDALAVGFYNQSAGAVVVGSGGTSLIGASGTGTYNHTGGTHTSPDLRVGFSTGSAGTYNISAGTVSAGEFYLGYHTNSTGTVNQSGGNVTATGFVSLGRNGTAFYDMGGGTLSANKLAIGNSSTGTFTFHGGNITPAVDLAVGYVGGGNGTMNHSAGSATALFLYLGRDAGATGTYNLSATGALTTTTASYVGNSGSGTFSQVGGTHAAPTLYLAKNSGSSGTYQLNGGTLSVTSLQTGSGTAVLTFNQGTLNATNTALSLGANGLAVGDGTDVATLNLGNGTHTVANGIHVKSNSVLNATAAEAGSVAVSLEGGTLKGDGATLGTLTASSGSAIDLGDTAVGVANTGTVQLANGVAFKADVQVGTGNDQLSVMGAVNLGGATLQVRLSGMPGSPTAAMAATIVNNDGTDAVNGTFLGLPEGATFTVNNGVTNYPAYISYAGGTGNDVVVFINPPKPGVGIADASAVTDSAATLNGGVNPRSSPTQAYFEYGTFSGLYDTSVPVPDVGSGSATVSVATPISGLTTGQTYYYRLVAINPGGTTTSAEKSFVATVGGGGAVAPTVTTGGTTGVTTTGATLQGMVNPNGDTTTAQFEYGLDTNYGSTSSVQNPGNGNSNANISIPISGLTPATQYHYRLVATNGQGTSTGADRVFTTANPPAPDVAPGAPGAITQTSATISGAVTANGGATTAVFQYGTTTSYGTTTATQNVAANASGQSLTANLTGLTPGTVYHYRMVATNAGGVTNGADGSFTTEPPAPTITNATPNPIGATFATLRAKVHPHGKSTTAYFEYGPDTNYGTTKPVQAVGAGNGDVDLVEALTGLVAGTTYHFRVVATSSQGSTAGDDGTFSTSGAQEPTAVADSLFVDSLGNKASRDLLANDVNNDFPPTTNAGLTFVGFGGLAGNRAAHGEVTIAADLKTVNYKPDTSYPFTRGVASPPPSDSFQYQIVAAPTHTATGTVNVYHFGSFKDGYGGAITSSVDTDGGALTLDLAASGDFTGRLVWQGVDYVLRDRFDGAGFVNDTEAKRNRDGTLVTGKNLVVTLRLNPDSTIDGTLLDQETTRTFAFTLRRASVAGSADPAFESFTAHMDQPIPALAEEAPRGGISARAVTGFGHFLARLSKSRGKLSGRFIGGMPDQEPFSSGSKVFADRVLLNARLYKQGRDFGGRVFGETALARGASFTSTLEWIKQTGGVQIPAEERAITPRANAGVPVLLPFDFHNSLAVVGDSYLRPGENAVFLFARDFGTEVDVKLSAGGLTSERTAHVVFTPSGGKIKARVTSSPFTKMTFAVVPATGKFTGTFTHPDDSRFTKSVKFSGAFRRKPGSGYGVNEKGRGSFRGFDNAGYVRVFKVQ